MKLNEAKCNYLILSRSKEKFSTQLEINGQKLARHILKSHVSYGTGPIAAWESYMGPVPYFSTLGLHRTLMIALKYGVPCCVFRDLWDRSHACLSGRYGTGPMGHYFSTLGLHRTLMLTFRCGVPCCVFRDLWDRSHACLWGRYGTGPILGA